MATAGRAATLAAVAAGTPWAARPWLRASGRWAESPTIISEKKMPMDSTNPEFIDVARIPEAAPRSSAGTAVHHGGGVGGREHPHPQPVDQDENGERGIGEVDRKHQQEDEGDRGGDHPQGGEPLLAVAVRQPPRDRSGGQEPHRHRHQVDARPQRRRVEGVAVEGQPDALQPEDQHELQAAASHAGEQGGHRGPEERPDPEQVDVEHGVGDPCLHHPEQGQQGHAPDQRGIHRGIQPSHRVAPVGHQAVGQPHHHQHQPQGEGDVPQIVDAGRPAHARVVELEVGPDGPEQAEGNADQKDQPPVDVGQQPTGDEPDEHGGDAGDDVEAEGEAAFLGGEGIGEDGRRVGHQQGPAHSLDDPAAR